MRRSEIGAYGEEMATRYLIRRGFSIVARNYRKPWGEIDIIATRGDVVHFVEVKTTAVGNVFSRESSHDPLDHADALKLRKVSRTAQVYMNSMDDGRPFQIDVMAVYLDIARKMAHCRYYPQVLE